LENFVIPSEARDLDSSRREQEPQIPRGARNDKTLTTACNFLLRCSSQQDPMKQDEMKHDNMEKDNMKDDNKKDEMKNN
jgi:hypothetical protein